MDWVKIMDDPITAKDLFVAIGAIVGSLIASGGFWAWLSRRDARRNATTQLLLGLAHDRIIHLGMGYIERGSITKDEYEDFEKYLFGPYSVFGGNGLAEKVMAHVKLLPMSGKDSTRIRVVKEHDPNEPHNDGHYKTVV